MLKSAVEQPVTELGWKVQTEKSALTELSVAVKPNPVRPLMTCGPIFDVTLQVTPTNSHYGAVQSANQKLMSGKTKPEEIQEIAAAMAAGEAQIRVTENSPYMTSPKSDPVRRLEIAGAAVAYQESSDDAPRVDTTLCFGGWNAAVVFGKDNRYIPFPFQHPKGTAFIENLCLRIRAVPEVTDEIVHKVNWQDVNAALTR